MPLLGSRGAASLTGFGGLAKLGYLLRNSLRFRGSNSAYLSRTPSVSGNRKVWTWSAWVKRGQLNASAANYVLFSSPSQSGNDGIAAIYFDSDQLHTYYDSSGANPYGPVGPALYRDPAAWYHIVWAVDAVNTIHYVYVNNTLVSTDAAYYPPNYEYAMNRSGYTHTMGTQAWGPTNYFDGYMAEVNFVDGQALTPSSFGKTDAATGQWVPKKFGGAYGTNGFYLKFDDSSAVGKDSSGNGNNWSTSGHSVTPGATYDLMTDVPTLTNATTANYATWNPLWRLGGSGYIVPTNGNLRASSPGNNIIASTIPLPSTGKWYMEFRLTTGVYPLYGLCNSSATGGGSANNLYGSYYNGNNNYMADGPNGVSDGNNANTTGDIGLIAVDVDNNKLWIGRIRSGTTVWMGGGNPSNGTNPSFSAASGGGVYATTFNAQTFNNPFVGSGGSSDVWDANFGQQPWTGTLPTGFKALNTYNLP